MQTVAQGWLVYQLTGSPLAVGVVSFASSLPVLLFSLPAGVLVDRVERRRLIVATQVLAALQALLLAVLVFTGWIELWHLVVLAFGLGTVNAIDVPARQTLLGDMVPRDDLMNAVALNSSVFNGARVVGPAIAGLLLAALGAAVCFLLNSFSFFATVASLLLIRLPPARPRGELESPWGALKGGLRYVWREPRVRVIMAVVATNGAFGLGYVALMPVFAEAVLGVGARGYGLLMAAIGAGAFVGAIAIAGLGDFHRKGALLTLGNLAFPLALFAFSQTRSFPLALLCLPLAGASLMLQGTMANTILQTSVPDELRGRVMSLYTLMFMGMSPFGNLQSGAVADTLGAPVAVALNAGVCLAVALLVFWRQPQLRRM